ncbi:glycosyltransferase family 1 protein [candidate division TA06 bacterium]|uniref:Glycosyltransferase family 1 protein n=1 Tax=candidate division TA06 bacterium TaxID=2250710 RepID=A0A523UVZ0_UNCT6|nr:MAG: glycosyltransferase family 1 protein [candidate division TA06 bacterium]
MNILIVTQSFYPDVDGGSGTFIFELGKRLVQRGHKTAIIGARMNHSLSVRGQLEGMSVLRYGNPLLGTILPWSLTSPFLAHSAAKSLSESIHFDVVWCHHYFPGLGGLLFAKQKGIPGLFTYHASRYLEWSTRAGQPRRFNSKLSRVVFRWWADRAYSSFARVVEGKCLEESESITVLSGFSQRQLESLHPGSVSKVRIIPGGVDTERFKPVVDRNALRRSLGLPLEGFLVLTVRRLIARMGLENLMDAMPIVLEGNPQTYLLIGGRGYLYESLRNRAVRLGIEHRVKVLGYIDDGLLPKYYAASDLFVLPTLSLEGFGMVTLEALASGTPVLATAAGASPEILSRLDSRLILERLEPQHIAKQILEFISMEGREELGKRCRAFARENYGMDMITGQIEEAMEEVRDYA